MTEPQLNLLGDQAQPVDDDLDTLAERFDEKWVLDPFGGCWIWLGDVTATYGRIREGRRGSRSLRAHRVAYELYIGPIPEGLHIDHLCRVRLCVNPAHLEAVTPRGNMLRGQSPAAARVAEHGTRTPIPRGGRRRMTRCASLTPHVNPPPARCQLAHGHDGLHRANMLLWNDPPLLLVGGEPPDLSADSEHWVDGQVRLSGDAA